MKLNAFAAERRSLVFDDLVARRRPRQGTFDEVLLKEAFLGSGPQMGSTRYEPDAMLFEFIFPRLGTTSAIVTVRVPSPERIVFLPVPPWVVENVWQGDVTGSWVFESEARDMLDDFKRQLEPGANRAWFEPQSARRRE